MELDESSSSGQRGRRVRDDRRKRNVSGGLHKRDTQRERRKKRDRRAANRIYKRIPAHFQFFRKDILEKWDIIFLENVGAGGVMFKLNQDLELGTIINMKMTLPGLASLTCLAKVIRVKKKPASLVREIAAHFIEMDESKAAQINQIAEKIYTPNIKRIQN